MTDLNILDSFVDSMVPDQSEKKKFQKEDITKPQEEVKMPPRKGAQKGIRDQVELDFEYLDQDRAVPTMIHLSPATRKRLMALVAELQTKHQRRFTLSQVGSKLIEKALSGK